MFQPSVGVAIKGAYGLGNFGDDALMLAAYGVASKAFPSSDIACVCGDAEYIKKLLPAKRILVSENENQFDILIYGGGTQFYSFPGTTPSLVNRIMRNARRPLRLAHKVAHRIEKVNIPLPKQRIFGLGIGAGPFIEDPASFKQAKRIFRSMQYVSVRDVATFNLCEAWGCRNASMGSDLCYLPGFWGPFGVSSPFSRDRSFIPRNIGVIVRDWPHTRQGNSYAVPLLDAATKLRAAGKRVTFVSFAKSYDKAWGKWMSESRENLEAWNPEEQSVVDFLKLLSQFDIFITARYHGAVFASILGKPVLCVEVEQKLRLISELLGEGSRLWSYPFPASECIRLISDLEKSYARAVDQLATVVETQTNLAQKMIAEFCKAVADEWNLGE